MIILEGNVTNKVIQGVNGDFSVGNFTTDIGQFKIRSQFLDQFDEGEYQVRVSVNKIGLNSYMSKRNGIIITEMELDIENLEMLDGEIMPIDAAPIEPDASVATEDRSSNQKPVIETKGREAARPTIEAQSGDEKLDQTRPIIHPDQATQPVDDADLATLFGHLWPLGVEVKLDSTAVRSQFIKQKDFLKENGYQFNGKNQTWYKQ